jgi:hypothetical protein
MVNRFICERLSWRGNMKANAPSPSVPGFGRRIAHFVTNHCHTSPRIRRTSVTRSDGGRLTLSFWHLVRFDNSGDESVLRSGGVRSKGLPFRHSGSFCGLPFAWPIRGSLALRRAGQGKVGALRGGSKVRPASPIGPMNRRPSSYLGRRCSDPADGPNSPRRRHWCDRAAKRPE